jgi:HIV Tat-specific factor 1
MADDEIKKDEDVLASSTSATAAAEKETSEEPASAENVTYENGEAIYTDEATKYKYKWCKETKQWKPMENEHYKWCAETQKWIPKVPLENEYYRWCDRTNQWIPKMQKGGNGEDKEGVYGYDEKEKCQTFTDKDGAVFLWVSNHISLITMKRKLNFLSSFLYFEGCKQKSVVPSN